MPLCLELALKRCAAEPEESTQERCRRLSSSLSLTWLGLSLVAPLLAQPDANCQVSIPVDDMDHMSTDPKDFA